MVTGNSSTFPSLFSLSLETFMELRWRNPEYRGSDHTRSRYLFDPGFGVACAAPFSVVPLSLLETERTKLYLSANCGDIVISLNSCIARRVYTQPNFYIWKKLLRVRGCVCTHTHTVLLTVLIKMHTAILLVYRPSPPTCQCQLYFLQFQWYPSYMRESQFVRMGSDVRTRVGQMSVFRSY